MSVSNLNIYRGGARPMLSLHYAAPVCTEQALKKYKTYSWQYHKGAHVSARGTEESRTLYVDVMLSTTRYKVRTHMRTYGTVHRHTQDIDVMQLSVSNVEIRT